MEKFTKYGKFMYNLCFAWTKFLLKHKVLYYVLACTWGIITTLGGCLCTVALLCIGVKCEPYYWIYCQKIKENWGGFEMGLMFVRDTTSWDLVSEHEFGHTFQNCLFGPFMILLVSMPSCIRYWYITIREKLGKPVTYDYDDIWFELSATDCGGYAVKYLNENKA